MYYIPSYFCQALTDEWIKAAKQRIPNAPTDLVKTICGSCTKPT